MLSYDRILEYRNDTYRLNPGQRLTNKEQAIEFVNERGYVYFWPIKEVTMPSLWAAVAGDRQVADAHDDPGHVTWGWKDELLGARRWYYAKILRKKSTIIALDAVPYFYALTENYGEPEKDYLLQYDEGRMTHEAKTVYETLLTEGPLDTVSLRKLARMTSAASNGPFSRAIEMLQADFKVLPVGIAEAGAWKYAFCYDCVHRFYPELSEQARPIRQAAARQRLAELYLLSVGAAPARHLELLFGWPRSMVSGVLDALVTAGAITEHPAVADQTGVWYALSSLT